MINIVTFKWKKENYRSKFEAVHVNTLYNMIKRNTTVPFKFHLVTDDPVGVLPEINIIPIWDNPAPHYGGMTRPNCFVRLKMFDPIMRDVIGDRFLWIDLDTVITGNIDHILLDQAEFKIWKPDDEMMPCNGSLVLHKSGTREKIWNKFKPDDVHPINAFRKETGMVGSDQAWIAQNLSEKDEFFGQKDGVYSLRCHIKKLGRLPKDCSIVFCHGNDDPWLPETQRRYPWIKRYYIN